MRLSVTVSVSRRPSAEPAPEPACWSRCSRWSSCRYLSSSPLPPDSVIDAARRASRRAYAARRPAPPTAPEARAGRARWPGTPRAPLGRAPAAARPAAASIVSVTRRSVMRATSGASTKPRAMRAVSTTMPSKMCSRVVVEHVARPCRPASPSAWPRPACPRWQRPCRRSRAVVAAQPVSDRGRHRADDEQQR